MIYFIQAGAGGPVKIGVAIDVSSRLRELQVANAAELQVLRVLDGGLTGEQWLHREFSDQRIRGEWFAFLPSMLTVEVPHSPSPETPPVWGLIADLTAGGDWPSPEALRKAKERGRIPAKWYFRLHMLAQERGLDLKVSEFAAGCIPVLSAA